MGSDNLFKKRKVQTVAAIARRQQQRSEGKRFLIVCEGMKTEPYYFEEICKAHQLLTLRVRIAPGEEGSSPDRVLDYAEKLFEEDAQLGPDRFDQVFCVIDRDQHEHYKATIRRIAALKAEGKPFTAIPSVPCFEYWLLLHFAYSRQPFHAAGNKSVCDAVIHDLRKQPGFGKYANAQKNTYAILKDRTETAIQHAQRAETDAEKTGEDNPTTSVHYLVRELKQLAKTHGRKG
jgi:hypothetical protein